MRLPWADELAIDLGTSTTHICVKGAGVVVREPSVIAFDKSGRRVVAVGLEAKRMLQRDVEDVRVVSPVRGGIVANFDAAVAMLRHFIQEAVGKRPLFSHPVITSHPSEATSVERGAFADTIRAGGGGQLVSVQRALATALGAAIPVGGDASRMVVDLGAGITDVGVVAMGLVTAGISIRFGGCDLDEAIRRDVKRSQGIRISPASAEQVKLRVGTLLPPEEGDSMRVDGVAADGEPSVSADISLTDVPDLLAEGLEHIASEIVWLLEELPPRQQTEIAANGAVLTGGGALLGGADSFLAQRLGIPVSVATDPLSCTILGLEAVLNDRQAVSLEGRRFKATGA